VLQKYFNPESANPTEIIIGSEGAHSLHNINSAVGLKIFLEHIQTFGSFFPKLRFVNCEFTPDCYETFIHLLGQLQLLQSLTFESCNLSSQKLVELLSTVTTLDKNLVALAIVRNNIAFDSDVMECFELLLQLSLPLTTLILDHNGLKENQILFLATQLKNNENIHILSLDGNSVTRKSALALAEWVKSHHKVRTCSLVHTSLTPETQAELDRVVERKPSPFVFVLAPPPSQVSQPSSNSSLLQIINTAKRYDASHWDLLAAITDLSVRKSYFKLWLQIGFDVIEFPTARGAMSFFSALARGCDKDPTKGEDFLRLALQLIEGNIHEFTESIFMDFPQIPQGTHLAGFLKREIYENGSWPENTLRLAIQRVLQMIGIYSSIYLFTPSIRPTITNAGELLPNPSLCFFETSQTPGSRGIENPIYIYYDGGTQFCLLTKKSANLGRNR
jgi:hypothetical protein